MILRRDVPAAMAAAKVREGHWERVRPGAFVTAAADLDRFAQLERRALARVVAAHAQLSVDHAVSHQSAALLWGLPLIDDGSTVHVIQSCSAHRGRPDLRRHEHRLADGDVVEVDGRAVTSLARTVADCAASLPAVDGLVLADAALRRGLDRQACIEILRRNAGRRGVRRALAVLEFADDGAESPGESRLRHLLLRTGLSVPHTQVRVDTADGPAWGDLGWEEWRLLVEYDGVAKYTARSSASDAVLRERRRELAIEQRGWRVVRATASDQRSPRPFLEYLLRQIPAAARTQLSPRPWLA